MKVNTSVKGGNRLQQRLNEIRLRVSSKAKVLVGVPKGAGTYENGTPIAVIAAVNEFGSADGHIPERSFLRVPLRANSDVFSKIIQMQLPFVLDGKLSMQQLMDQLGLKAAGVSKQAIEAGIAPPNAPSTVKRKDSATPLIDQGTLLQAITYVVEGENA